MKKIILVFTTILFLWISISPAGFAKKEVVTSHKLSSPLNIDGSMEDWNVPLVSEKKYGVDYAFQNDGQNLFILFVFNDPKYLSSINQTGLTVWFNTEGKQKKDYGITFSKKRVSADFYISFLEEQQGPLPEAEKQKIRANPFYYFNNAEVKNKKKEESAEPTGSGEATPAVFRTEKQGQSVVYEFAIPLNRPVPAAAGIGTEAGQAIKVCFDWGGLTDEMRKRMIDRQVGREGRATLSEIDRRSSQGGSSGPKKYSFWLDVQLAEK